MQNEDARIKNRLEPVYFVQNLSNAYSSRLAPSLSFIVI
jgi:hypothetical protein